MKKTVNTMVNTTARSMCTVSVMDDCDPDIRFDSNGICQYVHQARERMRSEVLRGLDGRAKLQDIVGRIKRDGIGKDYDCIVGVSGGVDSSYALLRAKTLGLRPLAVHVDNGWNTELAISNIERMLRALDVDLETHVIDWQEMRDLQRAFFKSSLTNVEAITDHSIFAALYHKAAEHGIRYIISGSNVETESIMPDAWGYDSRDAHHIVAIHKKFGQMRKLRSFPLLFPAQFLKYVFVNRIAMVPILNYDEYNKETVLEHLKTEMGYIKYKRKHGESRFTRFFQEYYLPQKFGYDKRRAHFSSLIVSGQMTRDEALSELGKPVYKPHELDIEIEFITKKLGFSRNEWDAIMSMPESSFSEFPNRAWMFNHKNPLVLLIREIAKGDFSFSRIFRESRENNR